jgi:hypothetical protein
MKPVFKKSVNELEDELRQLVIKIWQSGDFERLKHIEITQEDMDTINRADGWHGGLKERISFVLLSCEGRSWGTVRVFLRVGGEGV